MEKQATTRPLFGEELIKAKPEKARKLLVEYWSDKNKGEQEKLAKEPFFIKVPELLNRVYNEAKKCGQVEGQDDPGNEKLFEARKKYNLSIEECTREHSYYFAPLKRWLEDVTTEWKFRTMDTNTIRSALRPFNIPTIVK